MDDEEIRLRTEHLRIDPVHNIVYSRWEREERKKKKKSGGENESGEDQEDEEEDPTKLPLDEKTLIKRICDTDENIREELTYYNSMERPAMEEFMLNLYDSQYIRVDSAGLTPDELTSCVVCKIKPDQDLPLRPIATQIENGSDFKSLLSEGLEENQIPRKWSYWKLIDPVALLDGKLIQGQAEWAASYYNNVFVFSTEDNMKSFLLEPKKYL